MKVNKANYARPCLVLRISNRDATICYFTTKLQYLEPGQPVIYNTDPDFNATGLSDSSCILADLTPDVPLSVFSGAKLLGRAIGEFKKRVEKWYGLPLK